MKLKYLILPVMLIITSCSMSKDAAKINIIHQTSETEYSQTDVQRLQFGKIGSPEYTETVNAQLNEEMEASLAAFDKDAQENKDELPEESKSVFDVLQEIKYNKNDFVSVLEEQYTYTGGAHGMTVRTGRNYDVLLEKELALGDLFSEEGWQEALNNYMHRLEEEHAEEYAQLWSEPKVKDNQDFYITDEDLVLFYQPYELSYYARGFVEFPIRLSDIRGYLKEDYYRLVP